MNISNQRHNSLITSRILPAFLISFLLSLTVLLLAGQYRTAAAAQSSISVSTDKLVYFGGDDVVFDIILDSGDQNISGDLVLEVYPPSSPLASDIYSGESLARIEIDGAYELNGQDSISTTVTDSDLDLEPGGYPVKVSLGDAGGEQLSGTTWISFVEPDGGAPMDLVLLWAVGSPPQRDAQGVFENTGLLERCDSSAQTSGNLLQHLEIAQKYPGVKTVYAIEPEMLDSLEDLADGFDLRGDSGADSLAADSAEAIAASDCRDSLRGLAASENVEILSSPYAFPWLPLLAKEGWSDGYGQYRIGDNVLTSALTLPFEPNGSYIPGLDLTADSLRYVAATGGEYAVLDGSIKAEVSGRSIDNVMAVRLRDMNGERITALFSEVDASQALLGDSPDINAFFAALANAYSAEVRPPLLIAAAAIPNPPVSAGQRDRVYGTIASQTWIQTISLSEANQKYRPDSEPVTLQRYVDAAAGYVSGGYYDELSRGHELFESYRMSVDTHEPDLLNLSKIMFTAESEYWAGWYATAEGANKGLAYLDEVADFVNEEFERLQIDIDTPSLQGANSGTATVTINNEAFHPFTVDFSLEGEGIEFPEGYEERIRIEPGTVQMEIPYRTDGWGSINAALSSGNAVIVDDSASVYPISTGGWIVITVAVLALLGGIFYYIFIMRPAAKV